MSSVVSCATGNWSSSTTWALVDSTSLLDSEAGNTATTTSFVYSSTFTPGAITIDGVAIKIQATAASGTFTLDFFDNTASSSVTTVTVNNTDLFIGWNFLKFSGSQTLIAGHAYKVGVKHATTSVNVYRDATAGNWSRLLRTTTTQSPVASDQIVIIGELTGAGTGNSLTVTMDNTASTSYGATTFSQSIHINTRGTLTCGVAASTNYALKHKGIFGVYAGGTLNLGTSGTPLPSSSTLTMTADSAVNVDSGWVFNNLSTINVYGASKSVVATKMTADAAAAATVIQLLSTSGWANGDVLGFAPTTNTATQFETKTISTVDSSVQVTMTAGLTNAHSGTSSPYDYRAEVINLTRNIKFTGSSTSLQGYVLINTTAIVNIQYAEFIQLGSATANKRGIDIATTASGTCNLTGCAFHDYVVVGSLAINLAVSTSGVNIQSSVSYNINSSHFTVGATASTWTVNNWVAIGNGVGFSINDAGGTLTNCSASGMTGNGYTFIEANQIGTCSGITAHSTGNIGIGLSTMWGTISSAVCWRNAGVGLDVELVYGTLIFDSCNFYSNSINNATIGFAFLTGKSNPGEVHFTNSTFNAGSLPTAATGVNFAATLGYGYFENCTFGNTTAMTQEFSITANSLCKVNCRNTSTTAATFITSLTNLLPFSYITSQKHNSTTGDFRFFGPVGAARSDTSIFNALSPSLRLTPTSSSVKFESAIYSRAMKLMVASGNTATVSVTVRKSVVGDGTAYNGNQPRLIVRRNVAAGISSDTVLATASGAAGSWETLTGTTASVTDDCELEFIVDCDGTTGWVNVDDFSSATVNDSKGFKFWAEGNPAVVGDNVSSGGGGGTVANFAY